MSIINEIKRYDEKKIVIGSERTIKYLKLGKILKVFLAKNVPNNIEEDIRYYAKLSNVEVYKLDLTNEELRIMLKKPFKISVLSILK